MKVSEQVAALEDQIAALMKHRAQHEREKQALRDEIVLLKDVLGLKDVVKSKLGLSPAPHKLLNMLLSREIVPNEIALTALGPDASPKLLDVYYCKIRHALPLGVTVLTRWKVGRYIPREQKVLVL